RVLFGELVSTAEVDRTGTAPTCPDSDTSARSEDAGNVGVVADWTGRSDHFRGDGDTVLPVNDVRRRRRRLLEVRKCLRVLLGGCLRRFGFRLGGTLAGGLVCEGEKHQHHRSGLGRTKHTPSIPLTRPDAIAYSWLHIRPSSE